MADHSHFACLVFDRKRFVVDSVLAGAPCTMLKLDVEGAEQEALRGAAQTIARWQPRLNVACYHRNEDLFGLPLLVHTLNPAICSRCAKSVLTFRGILI